MDTATLADIKKELRHHSETDLIKLCLRLAQYKKENKELLGYLLFESNNEEGYILKIKEEVNLGFRDINTSSFYLAKKTVRKLLRIVKKHIKYSGNKETEVNLLLFFCTELLKTNLKIKDSKVLYNLFLRQKKLIYKSLETLHEDIQYDYKEKTALLDIE